MAVFSAAALIACSSDKAPLRELTGAVLDVEASGLTTIDSFVLRSQGKSYEIFVTPDTKFAFPPAHISEHRVAGQPIHVTLEQRGDKLFAVSVEDG